LYSLAGYAPVHRKDDAKSAPGVYCADTMPLYLVISADCRPPEGMLRNRQWQAAGYSNQKLTFSDCPK
jgi:hypothetical protein